jgi:hypothetical protein
MFGYKSGLNTTKELKSVKMIRERIRDRGEKHLQTSKLMKKMQSKQSKPRVVKRRKMT